MLRELKTSVVALTVLGLLTGIVFPLALTALARIVFPWRASGSLVVWTASCAAPS